MLNFFSSLPHPNVSSKTAILHVAIAMMMGSVPLPDPDSKSFLPDYFAGAGVVFSSGSL